MDPTDPTARRFPLIARPRPACTPLPQRVADLHNRATTAARLRNTAQATAVFNLAALLASDCGLPELARQWCHRLAGITLCHHPTRARLGLEPIVNLARLRTRAGDGQGAWNLLETLYRAATARTDTIIDGIDIPLADLTHTPEKYRDLRTWLWTVLLADGSRALAAEGQWQAAHHNLQQLKGIGRRMLDGRQIAVLAHATSGNNRDALTLLRDTQAGEPWEAGVTACLTLLCQPDHTNLADLVSRYDATDSVTTGPVFHTRLGLCLLDQIANRRPALGRTLIGGIVQNATTDGYAARDVLAHPGCRNGATSHQLHTLTTLVRACGLDQGFLPDDLRSDLGTALDIAEQAIIAAPTTRPITDRKDVEPRE